MCGIVGYIGDKNAVDIIMAGLHRLEYRGYDSAGVAVVRNGSLDCIKSLGKLKVMDENCSSKPRWTGPRHRPHPLGHPRRAERTNSHPHFDGPWKSPWCTTASSRITRNCASSSGRGREFRSQTDTETIAHLVRKYYEGDLFAAVQRALAGCRRRLCHRRHLQGQPGCDGGGAPRQPAHCGLGDGEAFIGPTCPPS
jgi:glutamine---fructose-6-phosphate transaminase (isomerizing)